MVPSFSERCLFGESPQPRDGIVPNRKKFKSPVPPSRGMRWMRRKQARQAKRRSRLKQWRSRLKLEFLEDRIAFATTTIDLPSLVLQPSDSLLFTIGGPQAGNPIGGNDIDGYDQVRVGTTATLGGTLRVSLVNNYVPDVGTRFDVLNVGGTLSGKFAGAEGLFSFPSGDRYFKVVESADQKSISLEVAQTPGGVSFAPSSSTVGDAFATFLNDDYFPATTQASFSGSISTPGFVDLAGTFTFQEVGSSITAAATSASVFMGTGYGTDRETGVRIADTEVGLLLRSSGYALATSGTGQFVGLHGLNLTASFDVSANTTGSTINATVGTVAISVGTGDEGKGVKSFKTDGTVKGTVSVAGGFTLEGDLALTKIPTGLVLFDATNMDVSLYAGNVEAYRFGGLLRFGMDHDRGFQLLDTSFDDVKLLGKDVLGKASSVNSLTYPEDELGPANLTTIIGGIDVSVLNHRGYIDVTFTSSTGADIDPDSITDNGQEFFFSGSALEDADFYTTVHLSGNTYRYYLFDKNSDNDDTKDAFKGDLFRVNENFSNTKLTLNFIAGAWTDVDGNECYPSTAEMIAVDGTTLVSQQTVDVRSGITTSTADIELGPLVLKSPYFNIDELQLAPPEAGNADSKWSLLSSVTLGVDSATFKFGGSESDEKVKTEITGLLGTFTINSAISPSGDAKSSPGKFLISVGKAKFEVKDIVKAEATGVYIGYDPLIDKNFDGTISEDEQKAFDAQEMLRVDSASIEIPKFGLTGAVGQYTRPAEAIDPRTGSPIGGTTVPGLSVRRDGFHLGEARLTKTGKFNFGSMVELEDLTGGLQDIDVSFSPSFRFDVDGGFFVAAKKAVLFPGKKFEMRLTDGVDSDSEAVRATLKFTDNEPTGFAIKVDQGDLKFGNFMKVHTENFILDTTATGINPVVGFDALKATVAAGPLALSGEIRNFGLLEDGSIQTRAGFGVVFGAESMDPKKLKWPEWLPIRPTSIGIQWRNLNDYPEDFRLIVSADVTSIKGLPNLKVSGTVKGLEFDVGALVRGDNPLTGLQSIGVTVSGDMFGGTVTGGLIGGVIPISSSGNEVPATDFVTPVVDHVFFVGLMGGFEINKKGGFTIRMALTENGPLGVQVTGEAASGILLEPISGLKLTGFSGGVEFFKELASAEKPEDLLDPNFDPALSNSSKIDAAQWERQVRSQTIAQSKAIKEGGQSGDFLAAFRKPLLISGGAQIQFHTPATVLKANAEVRISIDPNVNDDFSAKGLPKVKILITGDLILFGGLQRCPVRMFANLTELEQGRGKFIMMAQDIPAGLHPTLPYLPGPVPIPVPTSLELSGYIEFKYLGPDGKPVDFFSSQPTATAPTATLVNPLENSSIALEKLRQSGSLDIRFSPTPKAPDAEESEPDPTLDAASITDADAEIQLVLPDGTVVQVGGTAVQPDGAADGVYRYTLPVNLTLVPGTYKVRVLDGTFTDSTGGLNEEQELSFDVAVPQAILAGPAEGARVDRDDLNRAGRLSVRFLPTPGAAPDRASITDAAAELVLSGAAAAGVVLGQPVRDPNDDRLYWYPFTGTFGTGTVTATVPAGVFLDTSGSGNPESVSTFAVTGPEITLRNPADGTSLTRAQLNQLGYLEVYVSPSGDAAIDESSLTDEAPEFTLSGAAAGVTVSGVAVPVPGEVNVYRYAVSGTFTQAGEVYVSFIDGGFQDVSGVASAARTETFVIKGVEAVLVDPAPFAIAGLTQLNDRGYLDVRFTPTDGATVDESSITDDAAEFELTGAAAADVELSGAPVAVGGGVYRYSFTGAFAAGEVGVDWLAETVADSLGFQNLASSQTFVLAVPSVALSSPRNEQRVDRSQFNDDGFIDITFADATGKGLDESTIKDAGQEFKFLVKDVTGKEWVEPLGVGINGNPLKQDDGSYRYYFSGTFEPGLVRVVFPGGSFADVAGTVNVETEQQFIVVSNAPAFQITAEGTLIHRTGFKSGLFGDLSNPEHMKDLLKMVEPVMKEVLGDDQEAALKTLNEILGTANTGLSAVQKFISEPLMTLRGYVRLGSELLTDGDGKITGARTTFDASGGVSVFVAGPVGAAAGRVVIEAGTNVGFGVWGVMELQAKLDFLQDVGIDLQGFASLQFNTTSAQQVESLSLVGFGEGGTTLTQTYQIPAQSFLVAAAGKLIFHQPSFDGSDPLSGPELFRISGVASLGINENGLQLFSKGDVEVGPPDIRLLDISGLGVFAITDRGIAGELEVDVAMGDIPAIKNYFQLDASARVVFNTTGEDVQVKVLDRFLEYLPDDFKARLVDIADPEEESGGGTFTGSASKAYVVGAAPPPRPVDDGTPAPAGPYFVVEANGNLMIAGAFRVHGDFYFEINATPEMFVTLNGSMALDPLGAAAISGTFHVDRNGAYGGLQIGGSLAAGPLSIFGASQFEFNTQAVAAEISRYKFDFANKRVTDERETVTLQPGAFGIHVAGYLEMAGSFKLQGEFQLENKPDVIAVRVDAKFDAFGSSLLYVNGNANIVKGANAGFVCNLVASARSPVEYPGVFELNANFVLQINSRSGGGRDAYDLGLARSSFLVSFDGKLNLLSALELEGSGLIEYKYGVFRMDVSMRTSFYGVADLSASGFFSSEGEFQLDLAGGFSFGEPGWLGVQAGGNIHVSLLDSNGTQPFGDGNTVLSVSGGMEGKFWIFGYGIDASVGVNYSSGTGLLSVSPRAEIDLGLFSIDVGTTFNVGTLKANPPIYVAGNANDGYGQPFRGGALYLNMGTRAGFRGYDDGVTNEHFAVEYIGVDDKEGGHIVRVSGNGVKRTFRGVTSIVADGDSGLDSIETSADLPVPVFFSGGGGRDRIIHRGSGPAVITGGRGDDVLFGGSGDDTFVFDEGDGNDDVVDVGGVAILDLDKVRSDMVGGLQSGGIDLDGNQVSDVTYNGLALASRSLSKTTSAPAVVRHPEDDPLTGPRYIPVWSTHDGDSRLVFSQPGHPFKVGDQVQIASQDVALNVPLQGQAKWLVAAVTADTWAIDLAASQLKGKGAAAKATWQDSSGTNRQREVTVLHDGANTAIVCDPDHGVDVGDRVLLESDDAGGYTGEFVVTAVTANSYSFALSFESVRDKAATGLSAATVRLGSGDDLLRLAGTDVADFELSDSAGGRDEVFIAGGLPSVVTLTSGAFATGSVHVGLGAGIDRLTLSSPTQALTLAGGSGSVDLGRVGLRVVAPSVDLDTDIAAGHVVLETRDTLRINRAVNATHDGFIDLRVFGDASDIVLDRPLTVSSGATADGLGAGWIRLVAPDGSITGDNALAFTAPNSHLIYKAKNAPAGPLETRIATLTFAYGPHGTPGDVSIVEQDDLVLTNLDHYDTSFAPGLVFGDGTFSGINWMSSAPAGWLDQVIGGKSPYAVVVPDGSLSIRLVGVDSLLFLRSGQIVLQASGKDLTIRADDVSFRSGAAQVVGTGVLSIEANQAVWNYRLGTAGENAAGSDLARDFFEHAMELTSGDLAALADGFSRIVIGRKDVGNTMIIGDAADSDVIKFTGQPRDRDARFRDPTLLLTDSLTVAGDVVATGRLEVEAAGTAFVQGQNIHVPTGPIDSGLSAVELILKVGEVLQVSGWLIAAAVLDAVVGGDFKLDVGSRVETNDDNNSFKVAADGAMNIAGRIEAKGAGGKPQLEAGGSFTLAEGGIVSAPGAGALVKIHADAGVSMAPGTAILAGVAFDSSSGSPVASVSGAGSNVVIESPREVYLPGTVAASQGIDIRGGESAGDHGGFFESLVPADHPLHDRTNYAILVSGTLLTFGDATDLVLAAAADVIVRGNIDLRGNRSNLVVQSDRSIFFEGFTKIASGNANLYGGVKLDGTDLGGADATGSSVTVYKASAIQTASAGSLIDIRGSKDVDIYGAVIAGGLVGPTGVTWASGGDATITVRAGEQVMLDSALQASRSVTVTGGAAGADDSGVSVLLSPASGINAAGLSSDPAATGHVTMTASGDLEMMGAIVAGATIVESAGGRSYDWAGHLPSDVAITAAGRAFIGGNTVNIDGNPITTGGSIRAGRSITIDGGSHSSGNGAQVHPNSVLSTNDADGSILITSDQDAEIRGRIASGGEIVDGVVSLFDGTATLRIEAAHQVRISREVAASKSVTVFGGTDPIDPSDSTSGQSVVVAGTGLLRTRSANGSVSVTGPQGMTFFSPLDLSTYNVQSPGVGSTITIESTAGGHLKMGGRIQGYRDILLNGLSLTTGDKAEGSSVELTETSLLETINGSIAFDAGTTGVVLGSLTAGGAGSDITVTTSARDLTVKGSLKAADTVVLKAAGVLDLSGTVLAGNSVSLTAGTDATAGQTDLFIRNTATVATTAASALVTLVARNDISIDGTVGSRAGQGTNDPAEMPYGDAPLATTTVESTSGSIMVVKNAGRLESGSILSLKADVIDVAGVIRTAGSTAVEGSYDVTFTPGTLLKLSGDIDVNGSMLVKTPAALTVTGGLRVSGNHLLSIETPTLTVGAAEMVSGTMTEQGGVIASGGRLEIVSPQVALRSGGQVLATAEGASIRIDTDYLDVAGGIRGGADLRDGRVEWTGTGANVSLNVKQMLSLGGQGYDGAGVLADVGGTLQATGKLDIHVTGGTAAVGFYVANGLGLIQTDATGAGAFKATAASSISITTDLDMHLNGLVTAVDDGADVTLTAGKLLKIDGLVQAEDTLTVTAGADDSGLSVYLTSTGVLNAGDGGSISLLGTKQLLIEGSVGQPRVEGDSTVIDTGSVTITTPEPFDLKGDIFAQSLVRIGAPQVNVLSGGSVRISRADGLIDARATGNLLVATGGQMLSSGSIQLFGQNIRVDGFVDNDNGTGSPRVLVNAVESIVVTGGMTSKGDLHLNAGVGADWSDARLTGTILSADLIGGLVRVQGAGKVSAAGGLKLVAGVDVELQADPEAPSGSRSVQTPTLTYRPQTIDVVVGHRQVAGGIVYTPVVTWVDTKAEVQTGVELVRTGTTFTTMDVTLTQDGYYNGTKKREYFIQGLDYANSQAERQNPAAPVIDWAGDAPAAGATFSELTDAQQDRVLAILGFKRLFDFSFTNAQEHRTQTGSTSVVPWTPYWSTAAKHIVQIAMPGLEGKYIRLPIDAELDLLRTVTQGVPSTFQEKVGTFIDSGDARYTQDKSAYTGYDDLDKSGLRYAVSYVGDGRRTYTLTDSFVGWLSATPAWGTSVDFEVGRDVASRPVLAPLGFLPDTQFLTSEQLVNVRQNVLVLDPAFHRELYDTPRPNTVIEFISFGPSDYGAAQHDAVARGGYLAEINSARENYWAVTYAASRHAWIGLARRGDSYATWLSYEPVTFTYWSPGNPSLDDQDRVYLTGDGRWDDIEPNGKGMVPNYLLERTAVETFNDFQFDWTSKAHDVEDLRLTLGFEWTSNTHDLFTEVPVFTLADTKVAVEQQVATTGWVSEPITEQRTVIKPVRVLLEQPGVAVATFSGDSLHSGAALVIDAGRDVTLSGLVTARNAASTTGSIDITAGRDFFMTGAKPADAAEDTRAATAGMTAVSRVAITTGGSFTLAASIDIKADDTAVTDSSENKIAITTVGDAIIRGTLTTTNRTLGEVSVKAGDDIELKGEILAGHIADVAAGTDGTGGITSDVSGLIKTLGSEVRLTAGKDGGDIALTDLFIETAGPLALSALSGSITNGGGLLSAGVLSSIAASGIDLGTVAAGRLSADVTGSGSIKVFVYGSTVIESLTTTDGGIGLQGTGHIDLGTISAGGEGNAFSIDPVEVTDASGNKVLFSPTLSGKVPFADPLYVISEGDKTVTTATSELHLTVVTPGDMTVNHTGTGPLTVYVSAMDGSLTINTDGDLTVVDLRLLSNKAEHSVTLNAGGDVLIGKISAGDFAATADEAATIRAGRGLAADSLFTSMPGVTIKAGGAIREIGEGDTDLDIVAGKLTLEAGTGIGRLDLAVNEVTKAVTTTGSITLVDSDGVGELGPGLTLIEASASKGSVSVMTTGSLQVGSATAGGAGEKLVLVASGGGIDVRKYDGIVAGLSSAGNLDLTAAGDVALVGGVTAAGSVTVTATGGVRASASDFAWSAGGPLSIDATGDVRLDGAIAAVGSVSILSKNGDVSAPVAVTAKSGTLDSIVLAASGNLVVAGASFPAVTKTMSLTAGREMPLGLVQPSFVVTGKDGRLTISAGGDLVFLADTVLKADARITLSSTGYEDDLGNKRGGTLSLIAAPQAFSTALTKELFLTGNTWLHLSPKATASDLVKLGGRVTFNRSGVLRLQTDRILGDGGASQGVLAGLAGAVASFDASKMELTDGTVLVLDEGSDATDQLTGVQQIALGEGSVGIEVPQGSTVPLAVVFSGAGTLRKLGGGVLVLSGNQTYTGPTQVEAGTLVVTGSTAAGSAVTVAGGILGGTGTVAGTVTVGDGGTLMVGAESGAIGSLTTGSLVFEAGSTLVLEVSPTLVDRLNVTGSLTIKAGATAQVTVLDGFVLGTDPLVLIHNDTGSDPVVGRFGSVNVVDEEDNKIIYGLLYAAGDGNDVALIEDGDPPTGGAVDDGQSGDIDFQVSLTTITAKWSGFTDGDGTGIVGYEWAIGTTAGGTDVLAFTADGITGTSATRSGLSLTSGTTYYVSVRAIDKVQNVSTAVTSDGVMADSVAPSAGTVKDGPTVGSDITYQKSATSFSASWSGYADANGSGIERYEWAIGTTSGGSDAMAFTSVGTATDASTSALSLSDNVRYFVTVKAIDRAGNATSVTSDGALVYSLPPVVMAANIRVAGGTAGGGWFKPLDTVTATWNDTRTGDNNSHLLGSVTIDFSRFGGPQSVPATLQDGLWTASYRIAAGFTGTNRNVAVTVVDLADNSTTTSGTDNAMIAIPGGKADFTDADGDRYRVQLTGPGLLAIDIDADGNGRGPIQRIQVAGTSGVRSVLNVVPLSSPRTGDKRVSIGAIAGTGLASISAASSDVVGAGIELTGLLGSLVVRDVADGASIRAGGTVAQRTTIRARRIGDGGEIRLGSTLSTLVAQEIGTARITAAAVGTLYVSGNGQPSSSQSALAGNFAADFDIKGNVDYVMVAGAVRSASSNIGGRLGMLVAAEVGAGRIAAGAVGSLAVVGDVRRGGTLASLMARNIGTGRITTAALGSLFAMVNSPTGAGRPGVAGNFAADLTVKRNVDFVTVAGAMRGVNWSIGGDLRALTVRGAIDGVTMTVGGTLNSALLGTVNGAAFDVGRRVTSFISSTFTGSHLYVGFTPINTADAMASATSSSFNRALVTRIDSFSVTARTANAFAGSTIAARQIGAVALSRVATDGPSASGVLADDSIRSVVAGSPNMRVSNRTAPGDLGKGQFRVRVV